MKRPAAAVAAAATAAAPMRGAGAPKVSKRDPGSGCSFSQAETIRDKPSVICLDLLSQAETTGDTRFDGFLDEHGSQASYDPWFASESEALVWFEHLRNSVTWELGKVRNFGTEKNETRLTCYFGDAGLVYKDFHRTVSPRPWTKCPLVEIIRRRVETITGQTFNTVLCNYYRSGKDNVNWHADTEAVFGPMPTIASVTLGESRDFDLRENGNPARSLRIHLRSGSLLIMKGATQKRWKHCLPKRKDFKGELINLTFRRVVFGIERQATVAQYLSEQGLQ